MLATENWDHIMDNLDVVAQGLMSVVSLLNGVPLRATQQSLKSLSIMFFGVHWGRVDDRRPH